MGTLFHDIRFGFRSLLRQPLFACAAILVLGLGIGANIAVFSVIDSVLLQPLPYPHPDKLLVVREYYKTLGRISISYPNYVDWLASTRSFSELALQRRASFNVAFRAGGGHAPERIDGAEVSANFLATLAARPVVGRDFQPADDVPNAAPVALIGDKFWRQRFAADPTVIGRTLTVDGVSRQIVGIVPPQVDLPHAAELYVPLASLRQDKDVLNRGNHTGFSAVGRLKPGVTLEQARADLTNIARELARRYPTTNEDFGVDVRTLLDGTVGDYRNSLFLLLASVGCVLLIACANVANLQLARATSRQKELAVRAALGASRWRLVRQMLTEGVVLSLLGGSLAVLLALWAIDAIVSLIPAGLPRFHEVRLGLPVLGYAALVALGTGVLVGIWPAWRMSARDVMSKALRQGNARGSTGGVGQQRMRALLVVAQMTLAVVLLAGAGLTLKSFYRQLTEPLGFNPERLLVLSVSLPDARYDKTKKDQFGTQLLDKVRALPGVTDASMGYNVPFGDSGWRAGFQLTGSPDSTNNANKPTAEESSITPGYLRTLGIPILRGRDFGPQDAAGQPTALIVDETFARTYFPDRDPIGQHIDDPEAQPGQSLPPYTIVGVAAHTRNHPPGQEADETVNPFQFYLCSAQVPQFASTLVARVASGDPLRLAEFVRKAVLALDGEVPVSKVSTMERNIGEGFAPRRLTMVLLAVFAGLALVLASIGLYGVTALGVSQRTRELGIRLALGAQRGALLLLILRQGMTLVGVGLAIGLLVALGAGRLLASVLYGVGGNDPATLAGVSFVLGAAALLACWLPAQRATRVDPMVALRDE